MPSDARETLRSLLDGAPVREPARGLPAELRGFSPPTLGLLLAVAFSGACASCTPAQGGSSTALAGPGAAPAAITVIPAAEWRIGPQDEFDPACPERTYVLANAASDPLTWEARASQPWLSLVGPHGAVLAPGESVEVPVVVDPGKASLNELGLAVAQVDFLDVASGAVLAAPEATIDSSFASGLHDGWTIFTPSADTRMVYVSSSSGNDKNDGLSPQTPKNTLAEAVALLRHGFPDWLLLQRGDVWLTSLGQWKKSGRSADEPMLVSSYGSAPSRPLLRTGAKGGIWTHGGGGSPATIDNLALVGLHFTADGYDGSGDCVGAQLLQPGSHVLIEDCKFEGYGINLVFQGLDDRHSDFKLRRSVIVDAYAIHDIGGHSQGLYANAVDGLLIEENVFDHNGWNENVPGAGADIYSHDLYIDNDNTSVEVHGNIIANASSHGMQLRSGGTVINNLFARNSIALSVGGGNNPAPTGVTATVRGNVILDGKDIDAGEPRGWGMWFGNIASGLVSLNVIANNTLGTQPKMIALDGEFEGDSGPTIGVHDLKLNKNILFNWGGGVLVKGSSSQITGIELVDNDLQETIWPSALLEHPTGSSTASVHSSDNQFFAALAPFTAWTEVELVPHPLDYWFSLVGDGTSVIEQVAYDDPERSLADYNATLGGPASFGAFMAEVRLQSKSNWRPEYTAAMVNRYIRKGF